MMDQGPKSFERSSDVVDQGEANPTTIILSTSRYLKYDPQGEENAVGLVEDTVSVTLGKQPYVYRRLICQNFVEICNP
jgi:hypothetical protein